MTQITLTVPDSLTFLPDQERDNLMRAGLREAIRGRIARLKGEIVRAQGEVSVFETKYGMPFAQFEAEQMPIQESWQAHEDYNDWFYWQSVLSEKQQLLSHLQALGMDAVPDAA